MSAAILIGDLSLAMRCNEKAKMGVLRPQQTVPIFDGGTVTIYIDEDGMEYRKVCWKGEKWWDFREKNNNA